MRRSFVLFFILCVTLAASLNTVIAPEGANAHDLSGHLRGVQTAQPSRAVHGRELLQETTNERTPRTGNRPHSSPRQRHHLAAGTDADCALEQRQRRQYLDTATRTWIVDDILLSAIESDLQVLINCTEAGDVILFNVTRRIRLSNRIILPWSLTLSSFTQDTENEQGIFPETRSKTVFNCPRKNEGAFLIRAQNVTLANLAFTRCSLNSNDGQRSILRVEACNAEDIVGSIRLHHLLFRNNTLEDAPALLVHAPSCASLQMADIQFIDNVCDGVCAAWLASVNDLRDLHFEGNKQNVYHATPEMLRASSGSQTSIEGIEAIANEGAILFVTDGTLDIVNATFTGNRRGDAFRTTPVRNAPFGSVPLSACISLFNSSAKVKSALFKENRGVYGAAIVAMESNLTLRDVILEKQSGYIGGALLLRSSNVRLRDSNCSDHWVESAGGCLWLDASSLEITDSLFFNNTADFNGGILSASESRVTGRGLLFRNNSAEQGGCMYLQSSSALDMSQSVFTSNHAKYGGICAAYVNVSGTLVDSSFDHNIADFSGSVLYVETDTALSVQRCRFTNNDGSVLFGRTSSLLRIKDSMFSTNSASEDSSGGAIAGVRSSAFEVSNSTFFNNTAESGGALSVVTSSMGSVEDSSFSVNRAHMLGGAAFAMGNSTLLINRSIFVQNGATFGADVYITTASRAKVSQSQFLNATAQAAASVDAEDDSFLDVKDSLFDGNHANVFDGAAMYLTSSRGILDNCTFVNNRAEDSGGAIYCSEGILLASNLTFHNNTAVARGGGIRAAYGSNIQVSDSVFTMNKAESGGGVALHGSSVGLVQSSTVENGVAHGSNLSVGGAFIVDDESNLTISDVTMRGNEAAMGGDIEVWKARLWVINSSSISPRATHFAGSVWGLHYSNLTLQNFSIHHGRAVSTSGAISLGQSNLVARDLLIVDCQADYGGGLFAVDASSVLCYECTFENNTAHRQGGAAVLFSNATQSLAFQFEDSHFYNNTADLGGGLHVVSEDKMVNCTDPFENCTFVALTHTDFRDNTAEIAGGAVLASDLNTIHINCSSSTREDPMVFYEIEGEFEHMDVLNSFDSVCPTWKRNSAGAYGDDIGSYARHVRTWLRNEKTQETFNVSSMHHRIEHWQSGHPIPSLFLELVDALGQGPVSGPAGGPVEAFMSSPDHLFAGSVNVQLEDGVGNFSGVAGYVRPGEYNVTVDFSVESLPSLHLTVDIRSCKIGESVAANGTYCQPCGGDTYNFLLEDPNAGCTPCPEDGKCDAVAIRPAAGYWHSTPCSTHIEECLTERACNANGRDEKLRDLQEELEECVFNATYIEVYQHAQCREGYMGPLCGACEADYGRARSFRCEKCFNGFGNFVLVLCSALVLLGLSAFAIKCSITSHRTLFGDSRFAVGSHLRFMSPLRYEDQMTRAREEARTVKRDVHQERYHPRPAQVRCDEGHEEVDQHFSPTDLAKLKAVEIFKITINYLQVIAIAISLNVDWTDALVSIFETAEFLGGVTSEAAIRSVDCLISGDSATPRSVVRSIVSILVPLLVFIVFTIVWLMSTYYLAKGVDYLIKRCVLSFMVVAYLTYISISKTVVNILNCIEVHDAVDFQSDETTKYWAVDTSAECYRDSHAVLAAIIGWPILLLFSFGFPVTVAYILLMQRSRDALNSRWMFETVGFLYRSYDEKYVFWESVIMSRKALLSVVVVFAYPLGGNLQGILGVSVLMLCLYFHTLCRPFRSEFHTLNHYEGLSLLLSALTFVAGLFFNDTRTADHVRSLLTAAVFLGNVVLFLFFIFAFCQACAVYLRSRLADEGVQNSENWSALRVLIFCVRLYMRRSVELCRSQFLGRCCDPSIVSDVHERSTI